ncbi:hypothetical protein R3P38DRAFT_3180469 [Favolaschia claudopus]|uniref:Uncharacterized protein n=1 Tax=Favolaschia claudopus TaxID=2862362 RepID=A0AAW0CLH7_9AGAR
MPRRKKVSRATYNRHSKYRHQLRASLGDSSDSDHWDCSDSNRKFTDSSREPPANRIKVEQDLYLDDIVTQMKWRYGLTPGVDNVIQSDESNLEDSMDPGSVDDYAITCTPFPNPDDTENASLDNGDLDSDSLARLRDPPTHPIEINNADLRFTLDIFLAATRASEEVFNVVRQASLRRHPDDKVFTLPSIKKKVAKWTGVVPILSHMCPIHAWTYTGPSQINL